MYSIQICMVSIQYSLCVLSDRIINFVLYGWCTVFGVYAQYSSSQVVGLVFIFCLCLGDHLFCCLFSVQSSYSNSGQEEKSH